VVVEIDAWERVGDGIGVAHGGIVPKNFGAVKSGLRSTERRV
jgi:hypothetical protein